MSSFELLDILPVHNTLGECVLWNNRQREIWWTDIHEAKLYQYGYTTQELKIHSLPERLASFGFTEREDTLICAFATGFALYRPTTQEIKWLAKPEAHLPAHRFNDGRVDRQGRFWAGTMVEKKSTADDSKGGLYCLTGENCTKVLGGIEISNSICWSPDGSIFYFADSPAYTIQRFNFDPFSGGLSAQAVFARTAPPHEPDGSIVDADGHLWNALWGGGKVIRYDRNGRGDAEIELPVSQPTCVAFGGSDMNLLFITTAKVGLSAERQKKEPQAGNLFIYRTPYTGLAESHFKI